MTIYYEAVFAFLTFNQIAALLVAEVWFADLADVQLASYNDCNQTLVMHLT